MRLVLASSNSGKLRELIELLRELPFEPVTQTSLGIESDEETGATFEANALLKVRHAAACAGAAAVADDSGLEVDALGGAPGIWSARYARRAGGANQAMNPGDDDAANNAQLIANLRGVPLERRTARYRCVLAFLKGPDDQQPIVVQAHWSGVIIDTPRGQNGFGYDPYFLLPELELTAAQLDAADKNRLSHRGQAMRALREALVCRS